MRWQPGPLPLDVSACTRQGVAYNVGVDGNLLGSRAMPLTFSFLRASFLCFGKCPSSLLLGLVWHFYVWKEGGIREEGGLDLAGGKAVACGEGSHLPMSRLNSPPHLSAWANAACSYFSISNLNHAWARLGPATTAVPHCLPGLHCPARIPIQCEPLLQPGRPARPEIRTYEAEVEIGSHHSLDIGTKRDCKEQGPVLRCWGRQIDS